MTREQENADRREWRRMLKEAHICRGCRKQDAYTLGGRTYCHECAEKMAEKKREERRRDGGVKNRAIRDSWRENSEKNGLCIYCGKRKAMNGKKTCKLCSVKMTEKHRERNIANGMNWPRGENGYCWQCNKRMAIEGKRLCRECYEVKLKSIVVAREVSICNRRNKNGKGHYTA